MTTREELRAQIEARLNVLSDAELADLARQLEEPPPGRQLDSSAVAVRARREQQAVQARAAQDAMRPSLAWALAHPLHAPDSPEAASAARESAAIDAEADALNASSSV